MKPVAVVPGAATRIRRRPGAFEQLRRDAVTRGHRALPDQSGDCFVSYQVTPQQLADFHANYLPPICEQVFGNVRTNFLDRVDSIVVIVDESSTEQGALPYGINFSVQSCNIHAPTCPRFGRLGNVWLTARDCPTQGPSLHELLHGWHNFMAQDTGANYTIPTAVDAHWGYLSAGDAAGIGPVHRMGSLLPGAQLRVVGFGEAVVAPPSASWPAENSDTRSDCGTAWKRASRS